MTSSQNKSEELWTEMGAISGHSGPVRSLDWNPGGNYLISVGYLSRSDLFIGWYSLIYSNSVDQTTRLHGPTSSPSDDSVWHELGRPQVHGYDLLDVAFIDPLRYVSIADEKVARVFEAPRGFVKLVEALGISKFTEKEVCHSVFWEETSSDVSINSTFDRWERVFRHSACLIKHWEKVKARHSLYILRFL